MSALARVGAFLALLVVVAAAAFALGRAFGPLGEPPASEHDGGHAAAAHQAR